MSTVWADIRSRRFLGRFLTNALAAGGLLSAAFGLIDVLFVDPFKDWATPAGLGVLGLSLAWGIFRTWPRPIEHRYTAPNSVIRVVRGDLLDEPGHIVVGACDTFDTEVPAIISQRSVQGQALERLWRGQVEQLDRELAVALKAVAPIGTTAKPGKTVRYRIGTVASLQHGGRRVFWLAYTAMNEVNEARASIEGLWTSLCALWAAVSRDSNGDAVAIAMIGGGQARISQILPEQDSIRLIAFSFALASRREKVCDELRIVVQPEVYNRLDHLEIQAFLDSLEAT